jgi:hypothetical protein
MPDVPKLKLCETVTVEFDEYTDMDYREVSSFWIKNCLGQKVYFKTRSREIAVYTCDQLYGKGHYQVSSGKMGKKPESESAVGRMNTKSRMNSKGAPR